LPRATTSTYRRITVRKRSRWKKKSCPNCSALSVTNWIPHRVTDSQLWVNIFFYIDFCIKLFFSNVLMFKFIYCLVDYGVVLLLVVVSLMAGSTTDVPMSPQTKPQRRTNLHLLTYTTRFLHRGLQVLHH
jgi:hypothetical protein